MFPQEETIIDLYNNKSGARGLLTTTNADGTISKDGNYETLINLTQGN
jgi:hypothetical protein